MITRNVQRFLFKQVNRSLRVPNNAVCSLSNRRHYNNHGSNDGNQANHGNKRTITTETAHSPLGRVYHHDINACWLDLFNYLKSDNLIELQCVTDVMRKKLIVNPYDRMYILDNNGILKRLLTLSENKDDKIRFNARHILHCVGIVPKNRPGIRILSIDGGGTRGVIAISVLKKLEALTNRRVYEMFDYCIGTSTGALLIAMLIASRRPLDEVLDIYLNLSKEAFGGRSVLAVGRFVWKQYRYSTATWENLLKKECREWMMSEVSCFDGSPLIAFVSSVVNHEVVHPYVFRSYELPVEKENKMYRGGYHYHIWEGLRATTAAPSYFSELQLGHDVHIDGALLYNNPTALGIREAKRVWPKDKVQCVVSIGAGQLPWEYRPTEAKQSSLMDTLNHVIYGATDTQTTHLTLTDLLDKSIYYRFNPVIKEITPLDEINNAVLHNLRRQTHHFIKENMDTFEQCARALNSRDKSPSTLWEDINRKL